MRKQTFCEYIDKYKKDLFIVANVILKNTADAEDAVGNAILLGYEKRNQLRNVKKFKSWILKIVKNEALKIQKKRMELPGDDKIEALIEPTKDHYDELLDIIKNMKEEYRLVVVLFYYDGLPLKDISDILGIPIGTVKSRLSRGREALKDLLEGGWES